MKQNKVAAGSIFPSTMAKSPDGNAIDLAKPSGDADWKMVVIFRGQHCPICTMYLNNLENYRQRLLDNRIDLVAVSGDSQAQLESHMKNLNVNFQLCYGLTIDQMQALGLYISNPRSEQETDHPFPEPGLFIINDKGQIEIVDVSNNPSVRPDLETLLGGLEWIRNPENNYPIRGTYQ